MMMGHLRPRSMVSGVSEINQDLGKECFSNGNLGIT